MASMTISVGARLCACAMACLLFFGRPALAEELPEGLDSGVTAAQKSESDEPTVFATTRPPTLGYRYREDPPALAVLPDGGLFVSGPTSRRGPAVVQIWDKSTDTWTDGGELAGRYIRQWALALPSGRVLHLGVTPDERGQYTVICEIGNPRLPAWQSCGSFLITAEGAWQDDDVINLATLADGRPAFMYTRTYSLHRVTGKSDEAYVYDEDRNGWTMMKTQWYHKRAPVGAPVNLGYPLLSVYDRARHQWIEANDLGAKVTQVNGFYMGWDPEAKQFAYVLSNGMSRNAVRFGDGCFLSGPPLRVFSRKTGRSVSYDVATGVEGRNAALAVFDDGTFVIAGRRDSSHPGGGFYQGEVSCEGMKIAGASAVEPAPAKGASFGGEIIYTDLSWKDDKVVNAQHFARVNQQIPWPRIWGVLLVGIIALLLRDRTRIPNWALYMVALGSVAGSMSMAWHASSARFQSEDPASVKVPTSVPCEFTGTWLMTRQDHQYRFTIGADGSFYAEEFAGGSQAIRAQTGTWGVVGDRFVWGLADRRVLAIHRIQSRGGDHFALTGSFHENEDFAPLQGNHGCAAPGS